MKLSTELLTPAEVGARFRVSSKTIGRWEKDGKLTAVRTIGGHRRYFAEQASALLRGAPLSAEQVEALKTRIGETS